MTNKPMEFCGGLGIMHSNKNGHNPYQRITMKKIFELLKSPQNVDKNQALWTTFCTVTDTNGRDGNYLKENGLYVALWVDIDGDIKSWETLIADVQSIDALSFTYTTASAMPNKLRARIIFPLENPIKFEQYYQCQAFLNSKFNQLGYKVDESNQRPNQPCFLPNSPNGFYQHEICKGRFFDVNKVDSMTPAQSEKTKASPSLRTQSQNEHSEDGDTPSFAVSTSGSVIAQFNAQHSLSDLLERYGYTHCSENRYTSPLAENKTGGVIVDGERWISFHESDLNAVGKINSNGTSCSGDAFDLYKYFEHDNDITSAIRSLSKVD